MNIITFDIGKDKEEIEDAKKRVGNLLNKLKNKDKKSNNVDVFIDIFTNKCYNLQVIILFILYYNWRLLHMKATGIVRKVDDLGRIVIPIELRKNMNIELQDPMELFVEDDDKIILKRYVSGCMFCGEAEGLVEYKGKHICKNCLVEMDDVEY